MEPGMTTTIFATAAAEAFEQQSTEIVVFLDDEGNPTVDPSTIPPNQLADVLGYIFTFGHLIPFPDNAPGATAFLQVFFEDTAVNYGFSPDPVFIDMEA